MRDEVEVEGPVEVRVGHGAHQRLRIGMHRLGEEEMAGGDLDDPAVRQNRDPVRDIVDHGQVVGDEQVGEAELFLQVLEQVQNLAWTETSRAETGSSQMIRSGFIASVRAMEMRCR